VDELTNNRNRDFGAPTIIGLVATGVFYWLFNYIDDEEYRLANSAEVQQVLKEENSDLELQKKQ
jgi:hypothetical protein